MINKYLNRNILISTFLLFGIGALLHFTYDFLGKIFFIGLFTPVNESIFEHLKLAIFPILAWWTIFYILKKDKYYLDKDKWFTGCLTSMIISILVILLVYYFTKYGIGKELVIVDIMSLYLALLVGQFTGYCVYKSASKSNFAVSVALITILVLSFIILTIYPPKFPIFKDSQTNKYGIFESEK